MRAGLIAKKIGMTQYFEENGEQIPVTVLLAEDNVVLNARTQEKDGYTAVQLGAFSVKANRLTKPQKGYFEKLGLEPKRKLREFRVSEENLLKAGDVLDVNHFDVNQKVDVTATSQGKGFAGVMKRHGFGGLRASHGVSASHRSHGSTGQCQDPGRVFKGKKMAGHMGDRRVTKQNLTVHSVDLENKLIFIKGSVPGSKNGWVYVRDAIKVKRDKASS
jgi:large subunit ribosomal protein L3